MSRPLLRTEVGGEPHGLLEGESVPLPALLPGRVHVVTGVVGNEALPYRRLHYQRERAVHVVDVRGGAPLLAERAIGSVYRRGRDLVDEVGAEELLDLPDMLAVTLHSERREGRRLLPPFEPFVCVLRERHLFQVRKPLLELDSVELELSPCLRLVAIDRLPWRPDVLPRIGVLAEAVPDVVDLAANLLLDDSLSDDLRHVLLLTIPALCLARQSGRLPTRSCRVGKFWANDAKKGLACLAGDNVSGVCICAGKPANGAYTCV